MNGENPKGDAMNTDYAIKSEFGSAAYKIAMMVIGALLTALLTIITIQHDGIKTDSTANSQANIRQDRAQAKNTGDIGYLGRRVEALERVANAQINTLQVISEKLSVNTDKIERDRK